MRILAFLLFFSVSTAYAQDGVRVATDSKGEYGEFAGTRQDGLLYGSFGFFQQEKVGARLTIGPVFGGFNLLYGFNVVGTGDNRQYQTWNELELLSTWEYVGISASVVSDNALEYLHDRYPVRLYLLLNF